VTSKQLQIDRYRAGNMEAAKVIAADPVKYLPGSLPAIWAEMVLSLAAQWTAPTIRRAA
jgi:hypothetical protein